MSDWEMTPDDRVRMKLCAHCGKRYRWNSGMSRIVDGPKLTDTHLIACETLHPNVGTVNDDE